MQRLYISYYSQRFCLSSLFPTAIHDTISAALHQCRTLIIILSPVGKAKGTRSLCETQTQLLYEQEVGLYDALTQNDPKIILVEVGENIIFILFVCNSCMVTESLLQK